MCCVHACTHLSVLSISIDDRPKLTQLQQFTTKDGDPKNLLQDIGVKYDSVGTCLLDDDQGTKLANIKTDHHSTESIMKEIFVRWLQGIYSIFGID